MKPSFQSSSFAVALLFGAFTLVGCGAALTSSHSSSSGSGGSTAPKPLVAGPAVEGTVFGGHAAIVGSHVYLLQPGTAGYGSMATDILGNNGATSANGYTISQNTSDPNIPPGWNYVTTDTSGAFSLTGAYNCVAGEPVYTYSYGGNATGGSPVTQNNTAIVQLAILGNCPSSGNFSTAGNGAISYVYENEVSTVAAAYVFQPFTVQAGTTGASSAIYVGSSNTTQGLLGIANAADTAAQLYSIQGAGGQSSSINEGEGHVANYRTQGTSIVGFTVTYVPNVGNGVVPEATINKLANILAACVDSTGASSTPCTTLFDTATETGDSAGVKPTDIARAAMDIARYPAGNYSTAHTPTNWVSTLAGIATGIVPYAPDLGTNVPNDFTIAINYPYTPVGGYGTSNTDVEKAESVAVDALGQIWITAQASTSETNLPYPSADRWGPLGVSNASNNANYIFGYVSVDGSNNAWTGNANSTTGIFYAGSNGAFSTTYGSGYSKAYTMITNQSGDAFFFASNSSTSPNYDMFEYAPGGTLVSGSPFSLGPTTSTSTGTGTLTITNATVAYSNSTGLYTYTFTATNPGSPAGAAAVAPGQTVSLSLSDRPASGGTGVGTNWPSLTTGTVYTETGTGFTVRSSTNLNITNRGEGSATYSATITTTTPGAIPSGDNVAHGAIGADGHLWLTTESGDTIAKVGPTGTPDFTSFVASGQPEFPAIDGSGNAWIPIQASAGPIYLVAPGGTYNTLTSTSTGANLLFPFGAAVDGNGNIWVTNRCGPATTSTAFNNCVNAVPTGYYSTLVEINGTNNTAISPPTNFAPEAQYPATSGTLTRVMIDPLNVAIDPSGNLWITNYAGNVTGGGQVVEIIGTAAPVVTPLSVAAGSSELGVKP
ncbi:MAG: hypothetical protein WBY53_08805 [Acidobacteriaceae bacterium]